MVILKAPTPPSSPPSPQGSGGGGGGGGLIRRSPPPVLSSPLAVPFDPQKKPSLEWVPIQKHPVFARRSPISSDSGDLRRESAASVAGGGGGGGSSAAWDAASSRLYVWDPLSRCVHRLSLRLSDHDADSASSTDSNVVVEAAIPSEKLIPDTQIPSIVSQFSLNTDGSSLILAGSDFLRVIYIYERISVSGDTVTCRTVPVSSQILTGQNSGLQALQISWNPFSNSHLGVLTSDSVFRLYDLSSDLDRPEQEYYLQPVKPGRCQNAVSICPVAFSYGGHHLWDRFSVFILFSDGSIYVLCPVVPFGSFFNRRYIQEIYEDVNSFGLRSSNPKIVSNSHLAISWLEATFPDLADQPTEVGGVSIARAHPYSPIDASLSFQGPLCKVCHGEEDGNIEGRAVAFLYSSIGKDSIIVTAWSSGQLQIDALADEIQPHWNTNFPPRLDIDAHGDLRGFAMICESNFQDNSSSKLQNPLKMGSDSSNNVDSIWLGPSPPLLRLALVDLALPNTNPNCMLSLFPDPLVGERFYCVHGGGIDLVSLHFLPFSDAGTSPKPPSVHPILATGNEESCSPFLLGFVTIADAYGHLQIVGITLSYECIVVEMKGWKEPMPFNYEFDSKSANDEAATIPEFISKELLAGPKTILLPASASLRSLTADSIEGRSTLHHYIKLFHENYVEYAHKVYIELKEHADYLKTVIDGQQKRLHAVKQALVKFEAKGQGMKDRIDRAFEVYELLEMRLETFKTLPARNKKPLSRAEREFKAQLDRFASIELDALRSSIEALNARMKRNCQPSLAGISPQQQTPLRGRNYISDSQMSLLKSSLERLSVINEENTQKLKLIENGLKSQEK